MMEGCLSPLAWARPPHQHHTINKHKHNNRDVSLENVMLSRGKYGGLPLCRLIDLEMARPGFDVDGAEAAWGGCESVGCWLIRMCMCMCMPMCVGGPAPLPAHRPGFDGAGVGLRCGYTRQVVYTCM